MNHLLTKFTTNLSNFMQVVVYHGSRLYSKSSEIHQTATYHPRPCTLTSPSLRNIVVVSEANPMAYPPMKRHLTYP